MARLGIGNLPPPNALYDPALAPPDAKGLPFETAEEALNEDRLRARMLTREAARASSKAEAAEITRLATCLAIAPAPQTLASSRYFREVRRQIAAALWELVHDDS